MKYTFLLSFFITAKALFAQEKEIIKHYIPVADSKVYVEESGKGTAIILLHAGNCDHRMWYAQVKEFSKSYHVLNCDIRGCGLTSDGDSTYLEREAIAAVMDSLRINKASFVALSLGSVAATDFALAYPSKVNKLILASPGLIGIDLNHDSALVEYQRRTVEAEKQKDLKAAAEVFVRAWVDGPVRKPGAINKEVRKRAYSMIYENMAKRKPGVHIGLTFQPTQLEQLSKLTMPILIIAGKKDMKDILMVADEYKRKGAKVVLLPEAAHMVNMEEPQAFNREVLKFLAGK